MVNNINDTRFSARRYGSVEERRPSKANVVGSIPTSGTFSIYVMV